MSLAFVNNGNKKISFCEPVANTNGNIVYLIFMDFLTDKIIINVSCYYSTKDIFYLEIKSATAIIL